MKEIKIIIVIVIIGMIVYFGNMVRDLRTLIETANINQLAKIQELDAGITFQTKRQRHILKTRDIIKRARKNITLATAFKIAESNLYYADKYGINPNFLLALQTRESLFDIEAVSPAGAVGLNQIWEPTAKMLCRMLGWDYDPSYLTDIDKSNELAALYIQILKSSYDQHELILACYNGGPRNAYYYKTKNKKLAKETAEYVPAVMNFYKEYTKLIGMYLVTNTNDSSFDLTS